MVKLARGYAIAFTSLHELELSNALELKLFHKEARPTQVRAVNALVAEDLRGGTLHRRLSILIALTQARGRTHFFPCLAGRDKVYALRFCLRLRAAGDW